MKRKFTLVLFAIFCALAPGAIAQNFTVTGKVTNLKNEPLAGATVTQKGTSNATFTNAEGNYSITIPGKSAVLVITYIGMAEKEVSVNGGGVQNVVITTSQNTMDEVVVVGYGTQQRRTVTSAISSVKADQIKSVSSTRIEQTLQGRIAGVQVAPSSGQPGAGLSVRVRGVGTNRSPEPVYVIDGVISGGMESLDPSEILSIEVLKDAASAAIYGFNGGNGIVLVTTKGGRKGSAEINYSGQYGVQSIKPNYVKMMNAAQYQQYLMEAGISNGPTVEEAAAVGNGTNWIDQVIQNAPQQHHSLSISGGSDRSTYYIQGNIFTQDGIVGGDKARFNRYTVRVNTEHKVKNWLTVGEKLSYVNHRRRAISDNSEFGSILSSALVMDPLTPVTYTGDLPAHVQNAIAANKPLLKDENGNYYGISRYLKGEYGNPIARINNAHGENTQNKVFANAYVNITPFKGFRFTSRIGIDNAFQTGHGWTPTFWFSDESQNTVANAYDYSDTWTSWLFENFASYERSIGNHNFTLLAGASQQKNKEVHIGGSYSGLFKEEDKFSYADFVPDVNDRIGSIAFTYSAASFFGRLNYDYNGKYLVAASLRRDGSSKLPPTNRWQSFPAASVGWIFTKEDFFPQNKIVTSGKIRASWGKNGSVQNIGLADYLNSISANAIYPNASNGTIVGAYPNQIPNPELVWEYSVQTDIGLDLTMLANHINLTFDWYNKETKNLITAGTPPNFIGNRITSVNSGEVRNRGIELDVSYRNLAPSTKLNFEIGGNISINKNEVTFLNPNSPVLVGAGVGTGWTATYSKVGEPIWYFSGYKTDGIFQTQQQIDEYIAKTGITGYAPKPGDPIVIDVNGDKQISDADQTKIGSPHPKFIYGAHLNVSYKGFDLTILAQGQSGNDLLMGFNRTDRPTANKPEFFYNNRWTGLNSTNTWFGSDAGSNYAYNSDFMVFDGSFLRIRQLQLGYSFTSKTMSRIGGKSARLYVTFDDFFTFTKYPGVDPEVSNNGASYGIDRGGYPVPRKFMAGVSITF